MNDVVQWVTARLNTYFSQLNYNKALNFDTSKTHSLGSLVYLSSGSGDILFHIAMRKTELIDVFMQRIGESCPQIKSCIIKVDNTTGVQRVQAYWTKRSRAKRSGEEMV